MMKWKYTLGCAHLVLYLIPAALTAIIVPAPSVIIESVTTSSITLNWTMPIRELFDYFTLEMHSSGSVQRSWQTNVTRFTVDDLNPGSLYTFVLIATRGNLTSDPSSILQETVPLPPSDLHLESFQSLILAMDGVFGGVEFTLQVPGIQAEWKGPAVGVCDCYQATITPPDGRVARPVASDRVLPGCQDFVCQAPPNATTSLAARKLDSTVPTTRKFIQLIPGETYTVQVQSTTCGHGYLGRLKSTPINATITLPPTDPPPVIPKNVTNVTAFLSWEEGGEIAGIYDNFQVTSILTNNQVVIHTPLNPKTRGRNVSGLTPCSKYDFEIYTLNNGRKSENNKSVQVFTKPLAPNNPTITNFNETSISLRWQNHGNVRPVSFRITVQNLLSISQPATELAAAFHQLTPGTLYNFSVSTVCSAPGEAESSRVYVSQATVPLPPINVMATCSMSETSKDGSSSITVTWSPPNRGGWDGFVIDYSPFEFESASPNSTQPILTSKDSRSLTFNVPATKRTFTVYVRSRRDHVLSSSTTAYAQCGRNNGKAHRQCRLRSLDFRIVIRTFNSTHLYIEIKGVTIRNITVQLSKNQNFVTTSTSFYVRNPCRDALFDFDPIVIFYPLCDLGRFCRPIRRRLCVEGLHDFASSRALMLSADACCNGRPYSTTVDKCCHGVLQKLTETRTQCCYTRWYDRTRQKCCGRNEIGGILRPNSRQCSL